MRILVIGSGGREHALCWAIRKSPLCATLYCAPGNAGIAGLAECSDIAADDVDALVNFAKDNAIDLVVVGPEAPLVAGLADRMRAENIRCFGPDAEAAQLEGSKGFMKDLCAKYNVPTAAYGRFTDSDAAIDFIRAQGAPIVVKADGLAAGKGVIIAQSEAEAEEAVRDMLSGQSFGEAGKSVVIEEFLDGEELSYFAIADGADVCPLVTAQDHKAVGEGDTGPNTGGMGAYSPARLATPELEHEILETLIRPVAEGMAADGMPFRGVLFAGIMVVDGTPKLLEFNVRFGDPECQALMMRLDSDIVPALVAASEGRLSDIALKWKDNPSLCVVMAAQGYPGSYVKNTVIRNVDGANDNSDVVVFHAGTDRNEDGAIISTGGRVLGVTALGGSVKDAQEKAYRTIDGIDWPEGFCRRDIGWRAI